MERGLKVCWPLRRAMFDIQIADLERRMPVLPILSLDEACGVAGMLLGTPNYYRVKPRRGRDPKTREEYEAAAASSQPILVYPLTVEDIEQLILEKGVTRDETIASLIDDAIRITKTRSTSADERARVRQMLVAGGFRSSTDICK